MNRMKELREESKLSKAQVARDLGMPYTTYVNYEKETREPNSEILIQVANYFHVSVDYLIGRTTLRREPQSTEIPDLQRTKLLNNYQQLNEIGKTKLLEYSDDLVNSGNYTINDKKEKRA